MNRQAFEYEHKFLEKIPPYVTPPYLTHERGTDQYGYAAVNGNFYWVPGKIRFDVKVLEFCDHIENQVISRADEAMYHAKKTGRDRIVIHSQLGAQAQ